MAGVDETPELISSNKLERFFFEDQSSDCDLAEGDRKSVV